MKRKTRLLLTVTLFLVSICGTTLYVSCTAEYYYNKGLDAFTVDKDIETAILNFTEAIRLDSSHAMAYSWRGAMYDLQHRYDEAIRDYDQALRLNPNDYHVRKERAGAYFQKGNYDLAIADYEAILDVYPDRAEIEELLIIPRSNQKRQTWVNAAPGTKEYIAEEHYQRGLDYAFNRVRSVKEAVLLLFSQTFSGDIDMAIVEWEEALRIDPNHDDARSNLELARRQRGY